MKKIKIKVLEGGILPVRMSEGASCLDVFAREISYDKDDGYLKVKLGFSAEIPNGFTMNLMPRSSISDKGLILCNSPGQIDPDFRGEVQARFFPAMTSKLITAIISGDGNIVDYMMSKFTVGESVAQISITKEYNNSIMEVDHELSETKRGEGGFGHTNTIG